MIHRCLDCGTNIPTSRKRCWQCSYRKQAADSAKRSKARRARERMAETAQVTT